MIDKETMPPAAMDGSTADKRQGNEAAEGSLWLRMKAVGKDCSGAGVIELLLIIVVLIAIVILFRDQLMDLADLIFGEMFDKVESVF